MLEKPKLLIATTNAGKLAEFETLLDDLPVEWLSLRDVGLDGMDVEENGLTFADNALIKARAYAAASGLVTLADDSGISVDALGGAPGVLSARYAPTAPERNTRLLEALRDVPPDKRNARFVAVIAVVTQDGVTLIGEGTVEGRVGYAPRGTNGFGYDPIFELPDGRTMAEHGVEEKNTLSHRGRALARLHPLLRCLYRL